MSFAGLGKFMLQRVDKKLIATVHFNIIIPVVVIVTAMVLVVVDLIHLCGK
jgi:TM2 domain-containing membrane protein YozV